MRAVAALLLFVGLAVPTAALAPAVRPCEAQAQQPATKTGNVLIEVDQRQFGQFVFLLARTEGLRVKFVPLTEGLERVPPEFVPQTDKSAVFHARFKGTYSVLAYTAKGDEPSDPVVKTFAVDGPEPTPPPVPPVPPGPSPDPTPAPAPGSKTFWVVVVEDEDGPDADQAVLLGDEEYWGQVKARGHSFRQYRPASPAAAERRYLEHARKVGLPALLLVEREQGRQPALVAPLPSNKAEADALIKKAGGK